MSTNREQLKKWFDEGVRVGATHMIVMCDTFDHTDFPVYVKPDQDAYEVHKKASEHEMQRVMEVYWLGSHRGFQLSERQSFHFVAPNEDPAVVKTPCCGKPLMGLGGDPDRAAVCWNPFNGVVQCHACGEIYIPAGDRPRTKGDRFDEYGYAIWKASGGGAEHERLSSFLIENKRTGEHYYSEILTSSGPVKHERYVTDEQGARVTAAALNRECGEDVWAPKRLLEVVPEGEMQVTVKGFASDRSDRSVLELEVDAGAEPVMPWAVLCRTHGSVLLNRAQYDEQLQQPGQFWVCPICNKKALWDDDHFDEHVDAWYAAHPED